MLTLFRTSFFKCLLALGLGMLSLASGAQQDFPTRPVRLIVSYPPGGGADAVARVIAAKLSEHWKQQVIVDNKPGGNAVISVLELTKARADGYTLLLAFSESLVMHQHLFRAPKYDPFKDITPIAGVVEIPQFLFARTETGAKTAQDYIARAKAESGQLKVGGSAVLNILITEILNQAVGIKSTPIQYKGSADLTLGILRGDVDHMVDVEVAATPHVRAGKLKILATSGAKRVPSYPDVPTFKEISGKDVEVTAWFALVGPAGMDPALVAKLNRDAAWAVQEPSVKSSLLEKSIFATHTDTESLKKRMEADSLKFGEIIRRLNLQID